MQANMTPVPLQYYAFIWDPETDRVELIDLGMHTTAIEALKIATDRTPDGWRLQDVDHE